VMGARLGKIRGRRQRQIGVIHTFGEHIGDIAPALCILQREARRFCICERSDDVMRPGVE
ncbi:hypothetical protein ACC715_37565, partial [Rhizobium ruizarguesonis]